MTCFNRPILSLQHAVNVGKMLGIRDERGVRNLTDFEQSKKVGTLAHERTKRAQEKNRQLRESGFLPPKQYSGAVRKARRKEHDWGTKKKISLAPVNF